MLTHNLSSAAPPDRVVVLGSRGFVARALIEQLRLSGVAIEALSSADIDLTAAAATAVLAARLRETDALVFISALTPDKGKDVTTLMRNLQMGQHVCEALAKRRCAHVVYVSSDAVYDDHANPIRESSCASPSSFHGTMHLVRERMLTETLRAANIPLAILRPSLLYGPGDTHNGYGPNRFVRTALNSGTITLLGEGEEQRDHVYIDDVARLIEQVILYRSDGVLNVATGRSWSFRDVAARVVVAAARSVPIVCTPRVNPISHRHFDVTAVIKAVPGFRFTDLEAGLERMAHAVSQCAGA